MAVVWGQSHIGFAGLADRPTVSAEALASRLHHRGNLKKRRP
ncbi:hypothetical protein [Azospirillum endophyticum]